MMKTTGLHTENTAQISEWLSISDTAKKLCSGESNAGIAVMMMTKLQTETQS